MIWLIALLLVAAAGFGIYRAMQSPVVLAGLLRIAWKWFGPALLKRKTAEEETRDHQDVRQRTERTAAGKERER